MPPPTVQPPRVLLSWWPVPRTVPRRNSDVSILAHAPPPVTYTIDLSHQVQPSLPRAVTSQRSCVWETQFCLFASGTSCAWPSLLVAEPSASTPKTHAPHCQLQPIWPPPMKPERLKESVILPPGTGAPLPVKMDPAVVKCWLVPYELPALAPT